MQLPPIVSEQEWRRSHQALLAKEEWEDTPPGRPQTPPYSGWRSTTSTERQARVAPTPLKNV